MKIRLFLFLLLSTLILSSCSSTESSNMRATETLPASITEELATQTPSPTNSPTFDVQICDEGDCNIDALVVYSKFDENHNTRLYLKNLGTGDTNPLTATGKYSAPKWSPDGKHILYLTWSEENSYDVYMMKKDGMNKKAIIASPASETSVEWSPDGEKIVFVSREVGHSEIYVMDLETENIEKLTTSDEFSAMPAWSFDGTRIAYQSSEGGAGRSQIFVMNADGTNKKQLTEYDVAFFDGDPVWCPNDACILFIRYIGGTQKIMRMDLQDLSVTPVFENTFDKDVMETRLSISPSGKYLTFTTSKMNYAMDLEKNLLYPLEIHVLDLSIYP
jgi:Tol biopolymer transport system component